MKLTSFRTAAAGVCFGVLLSGAAAAQAPKPKPKTAANAAPVERKATLLIKSDLEAQISLDGEPIKKKGEEAVAMSANEIVRRMVGLGEHIIEATTSDGLDSWREVLDVDKIGQRVVVIELKTLKEAREAKAEATRKAQLEADARKKQAADDKAEADRREAAKAAEDRRRDAQAQEERTRLESAQQERDKKAEGLRGEIARLEERADRAERDAERAGADAERYERQAQDYERQGNAASAAIIRINVTVSRNNERSKRAQAQDARTRIRQLGARTPKS